MFGLDNKSLIVGAILGAVVIPRVVALVAAKTAK